MPPLQGDPTPLVAVLPSGEVKGDQIVVQSPAEILEAHPRADASATITIGGSFTQDDTIKIRFAAGILPNGEVLLSVTVASGDTAAVVASKAVAAINGNATLRDLGIVASSAAGVVTVKWPGPIAQASGVALEAWSDTPSTTIAVGGTATAGERIYAKFVNADLPGGAKAVYYEVQGGQTTTQMATGLKNAINADTDLAAEGITATSSGGTITVAVGSESPTTIVSGWAYKATRTATVGGTVTASETVSITFTNANLPGGDTTVQYTVQGGDNEQAVAAGLEAAIDGNSELQAAGITASSAAGVVTISIPATLHNTLTLSKQDGANTTLTLDAAPTETVTVSGNPTETATVGAFTGGSGPIIPIDTFSYVFGNALVEFRAGHPVLVPADLLAAMLADGLPIY